MSAVNRKLPKCKNKKYVEHVKVQIEIYERFLSMKDVFFEVFKKFDGKVINKKFTDALSSVCPMHKVYGDKMIPDFRFSFDNYKGEISIEFCGIIKGNNDLYFNRYENSFTIHNYPYLYNNRLEMSKMEEPFELFFKTIEKCIEYHINNLRNFDEVSKVYEKAYKMLSTVYDKKDCIFYANDWDTISDMLHLQQLRNVYIPKYMCGNK